MENKWLIESPILENLLQDIVMSSVKANADFQYGAGMRPRIIRTSAGYCCDWCQKIAGEYYVDEAPRDVYRRHANCKCVTDIIPGGSSLQTAWTKRVSAQVLAERKRIGLDEKKTAKEILKEVEEARG